MNLRNLLLGNISNNISDPYTQNAYSINKNGQFKNLTPLNAISSSIYGVSKDGTIAYGQLCLNKNEGATHSFIVSNDGVLSDITPLNALDCSIWGSLNNDYPFWGRYHSQDGSPHYFIMKRDGTLLDINDKIGLSDYNHQSASMYISSSQDGKLLTVRFITSDNKIRG